MLWAAFFNFVAFLVFGLHVAATVGKGIIDPAIVDHYVVFGALIGAISWNIITWYFGIPSSSSHALIGGLVGRGGGQRRSGLAGGVGIHQDRARPSCCRRCSASCSARC